MSYEVWKPVSSNPNYMVSNTGRVKRSDNSREKSVTSTTDGYGKVDLYDHGHRKTYRVHRLVSEAFIDGDHSMDINHSDGDKRNNNVDNLEYATKSENMKHAWRMGLEPPHTNRGMLGRKNPNGGRKGLPIRVNETDEVYPSIVECATKLGLNEKCITECLHGRQKAHKGYTFTFE